MATGLNLCAQLQAQRKSFLKGCMADILAMCILLLPYELLIITEQDGQDHVVQGSDALPSRHCAWG